MVLWQFVNAGRQTLFKKKKLTEVIPIKYQLISTVPQRTAVADSSESGWQAQRQRFLLKEPQISDILYLRAVKIRTSQWR